MSFESLVQNTENQDLFVWVWDLLTSNQQMILDGVRLRPGETARITLEQGKRESGKIRWRTQAPDDSDLVKVNSAIVHPDSPVAIDLYDAALLRSSNSNASLEGAREAPHTSSVTQRVSFTLDPDSD
jgi:hypothetical protein